MATSHSTAPAHLDDPVDRASLRSGRNPIEWLIAHAASLLLWTALGAGALFRIVRYVDNRSLWLDESFLALNLLDKSARDILGSLDYAQSAPPAFLLVEKGAMALLGDSEQALRLFPLASSLVALGAFAWLARRLFVPWAAAVAVALFATNEFLVYQASELKQYSSDAAVAVVMLALYVWFEQGAATLRRALPLIVAGALAPLLSFPAAVVLAGVGCGVLLRLWTDGTRRAVFAAGGLMAVWLVTFGAVLVSTSDTVAQIRSQVFHDSSASESLAKVAELAWSVYVSPGNFTNGTNALAALLSVLGFIAVVRVGPLSHAAALSIPPVLAIFAALAGKYPIGGRYSLFLVPFLIIFVVRGLEAVVRDSRRPYLLGGALIVILVVPPAVEGVGNTLSPPRGEDVRPLIETAAAGWRDGDALYVFRNSQFPLRYYTECDDCRSGSDGFPWPTRLTTRGDSDGRFPDALDSVPPTVIVGTQSPDHGTDHVGADLPRLPKHGRLWMLFSHVPTWEPLNQETFMRRELDRRGEVVDEWRAGTADLVLYDFGP